MMNGVLQSRVSDQVQEFFLAMYLPIKATVYPGSFARSVILVKLQF